MARREHETATAEMDLLRLLQKVRLNGDNCWEWQASTTTDGYGTYGGGMAYRVLYQFFYGPIPAGLQLDHLCRNRLCVNPIHLEVVTQSENVRRGIDAKLRGCCKRGHKWTDESTGHGQYRNLPIRYCKVCKHETYLRNAALAGAPVGLGLQHTGVPQDAQQLSDRKGRG